MGYPYKRFRSAAYNVSVHPLEKSAVRFHLASLEALGWNAAYAPPRIHLDEGRVPLALGVEEGRPHGATDPHVEGQ